MPGVGYCEYHYLNIKSKSERRKLNRSSDKEDRKRKREVVMLVDPDPDRSSDSTISDRRVPDPAAEELIRMAIKRRMERRDKRMEKERRTEVRMDLPNGVMAISSGPVRVSSKAGEILDRKIGLGFDDDCLLRRCFRSKNAEPMPIGPVKKLPRVLGSSPGRICQGCSEKSCKTCMRRGALDSELKMLPAQQLSWEQMSELEIEAKNQGGNISGVRLQVAVYGHDEQVKCSNCGISIGNFHRSCSRCSYKLCLSCCREIRGGSLLSEVYKHVGKTPNGANNKFSKLHSSVLVEQGDKIKDDNISCPTSEKAGCGDGILNMKFLLPSDCMQRSDT